MAEQNASRQEEAPQATSDDTPPNHRTEEEERRQKSPHGQSTTHAVLDENPAPNIDPEEAAKGHS